MSSANHPQMDRQMERVNRCLETFLRCFTHAFPNRWSFWLPLAQFWYNSSDHSAIGVSPFRAMYGHETPHWEITPTNMCSMLALISWLEERAIAQNLLQQHLHPAKQYMKQHVDKRTTFCAFEVGDRVFLMLQPYIKTSVATRANHKLAFKFFEPFCVLEHVNEVA